MFESRFLEEESVGEIDSPAIGYGIGYPDSGTKL